MTVVITKQDRHKGLRMSEPCKYETEIALMSKGVEDLTKSQDDKFLKLFKLLEGNGSVGIVTQTELNKQSLTRAWWFMGIGIPAGTAIIGGLILLL